MLTGMVIHGTDDQDQISGPRCLVIFETVNNAFNRIL